MATLGSKPISSGASTVAPNIATTCWSPSARVWAMGRRSSGAMTPDVRSVQRGKYVRYRWSFIASPGCGKTRIEYPIGVGVLQQRSPRGHVAGLPAIAAVVRGTPNAYRGVTRDAVHRRAAHRQRGNSNPPTEEAPWQPKHPRPKAFTA